MVPRGTRGFGEIAELRSGAINIYVWSNFPGLIARKYQCSLELGQKNSKDKFEEALMAKIEIICKPIKVITTRDLELQAYLIHDFKIIRKF